MPATMPAESGGSDWARLNAIADGVRAGWPLWPIGYDGEPPPGSWNYEDITLRDPASAGAARRSPGSLYLASGLPDDRRRPIGRHDDLYALALHAWRFQDGWDGDEHESFWTGALRVWPSQGHKPSHREALALAIAMAVERQVPDLEKFLGDLGAELRDKNVSGLTATAFSVRRLVRERIVERAIAMLAKPRHLVDVDGRRFPRVEPEANCDLVHPVACHSFSYLSKAGEASIAIIDAADRLTRRLDLPPAPGAA